MTDLSMTDLATTTIAGTDVTVQQLVDAFIVSLDGKLAHELEDHFGQDAEMIGAVRNEMLPIGSMLRP